MGAVSSIEDLEAVEAGLEDLAEKFPEAYPVFVTFFKRHRMIGYKNIMKMMLYDKSPLEVKG